MSNQHLLNCARGTCECANAAGAASQAIGAGVGRRDFLRMLGAGAGAAMTLSPWSFAMAGPFTRADFEKLVPSDKKLSPEWLKSLTARGERTTYHGAELAKIGMPIGGLCAGQLYLGGDGRLWHWDIFNRKFNTGAEHYANPMKADSPLDQGFALRVAAGGKSQERLMDAAHWKSVSFTGEYPIGYVAYEDPECPVNVRLEGFSPFIPLDAKDSSLPATVLEFTLKNIGSTEVEGEFAGWLENAVCLYSGQQRDGLRRNRIMRDASFLFLDCGAEALSPGPASNRPDIVFDDFESDTYGKWTATGTAFGTGPVLASRMPEYQGDVGAKGKRLVNSHASAPGKDVGEKDAATGRLTSRTFPIERNYITFLIGGGNHKGRTCMNLVVDEKVVLSATGAANNRLQPMSWDVRPWAGRAAQLVIIDDESGAWGNIGVDDIVFSDRPREPVGPLADEEDFGSMGLALLDPGPRDTGTASLPTDGQPAGVFSTPSSTVQTTKKPFSQKLAGSLARRFKLGPGEVAKCRFLLVWYFPNLKMNRLPSGRFYQANFSSAQAVAAFVAQNFSRLAGQTRLWHDTWYDSSLPYWFLDRTFLNISILATSTCYRFADGRFYSWEGVGCCEGTCGHVWQYAQAMARLFPELERMMREEIDFGLALQADGAIHFRGEFNDIPAIDAQAGTILRALREHEMSADARFLRRNWPRFKAATEWLIKKDGNGDGLIESNQHNTLDTDWYGPVAWLSGLYLAALLAAEAMAIEVDDREFAASCRKLFELGQKNLVSKLFDKEYFLNKVDNRHLDAINSGTGCEIDQVMGQSWAFQVGLPRVLPQQETQAALRSLWRYNFTPDVGPYREAYKAGRWYAMPGEAGLLMCTFPRSDWDYNQAKGKGPDWAAGYFNECMNGFEYQVAGHMIWEGLVTEGLAVTRAVHDRYHPSRRNPWNEVECGDHYVRSMASYGVYTAICGFEYHGPKGRIGFAPRLTPENFKAAFTAAEGWGTYRQARAAGAQSHEIEVRHGRLQLSSLRFELAPETVLRGVAVRVGNATLPVRAKQEGRRVEVTLTDGAKLEAGQTLKAECSLK
jgi:non-lysosomal glucosylceramidase